MFMQDPLFLGGGEMKRTRFTEQHHSIHNRLSQEKHSQLDATELRLSKLASSQASLEVQEAFLVNIEGLFPEVVFLLDSEKGVAPLSYQSISHWMPSCLLSRDPNIHSKPAEQNLSQSVCKAVLYNCPFSSKCAQTGCNLIFRPS